MPKVTTLSYCANGQNCLSCSFELCTLLFGAMSDNRVYLENKTLLFGPSDRSRYMNSGGVTIFLEKGKQYLRSSIDVALQMALSPL